MTIDDHINEVMDNLDFYRIWRTMEHLNWVWFSAENGVPSVPELRKQVRKLMNDVYKDCRRYSYNPYTIGTGGFQVTYDKEWDTFDVKFVLSEWTMDYEVL
jgi:hypothetical protein